MEMTRRIFWQVVCHKLINIVTKLNDSNFCGEFHIISYQYKSRLLSFWGDFAHKNTNE